MSATLNHWLVLFEDAPEMLKVREKYFVSHLDYLASQSDIFVDGAPLSPNEGAVPTGGMWIVKARSRDEIVQLIDGDPMFQSGHRTFQIFATGKVLTTG